MTETEKLAKAALAVCDRWDTPDWSDHRHTADFIRDLREALTAWNTRPSRIEELERALGDIAADLERRAAVCARMARAYTAENDHEGVSRTTGKEHAYRHAAELARQALSDKG
jgi:hypothetical protein